MITVQGVEIVIVKMLCRQSRIRTDEALRLGVAGKTKVNMSEFSEA